MGVLQCNERKILTIALLWSQSQSVLVYLVPWLDNQTLLRRLDYLSLHSLACPSPLSLPFLLPLNQPTHFTLGPQSGSTHQPCFPLSFKVHLLLLPDLSLLRVRVRDRWTPIVRFKMPSLLN